jgi:hypothetical protein
VCTPCQFKEKKEEAEKLASSLQPQKTKSLVGTQNVIVLNVLGSGLYIPFTRCARARKKHAERFEYVLRQAVGNFSHRFSSMAALASAVRLSVRRCFASFVPTVKSVQSITETTSTPATLTHTGQVPWLCICERLRQCGGEFVFSAIEILSAPRPASRKSYCLCAHYPDV